MNPSLIECADTTVLDCGVFALDPDCQAAGDDARRVKGCREDNSRHFFGTTGSSVAEFPSPAGHELQPECALHDPMADLPRFLSWAKTKRHATGEHYLIKSQDGRLLGLRYACDVPGKSKSMDSAQWDVEKLQWRVGGFFLKNLYGLEHLQSKPDAKVLLVKGEKTCEAARALFPDMAVLALMGTRSEQKVDLDPVLARTVIIWPNADPDGIDAARTLAARLHKKRPKSSLQNATAGQGFQLPVKRPGSVSLVELPDTLLSWMKTGSTEPGGWNLSEPVSEGVDIRAILNDAKPWKQCGPDPQAKDCDLPNQAGGYLIFDKRICIEKNGEPHPLCNFTARIREVQVMDDGDSEEAFYILEGESAFGCHFPAARVSAASFGSLAWVPTHWHASAIINAGASTKDQLRAAIYYLSRPKQRKAFLNTGWRNLNDQWLFLHAGGAIGPNGPLEDVELDLKGRLALYDLPVPLKGETLAKAFHSSTRTLDLGPLAVTAPVWLSAFRATIDDCAFSIHLSGSKGGGKTELASIATGHFGADLHAKEPLESWESTVAALERSLFLAKDVLGLVDDFRPHGAPKEIAELNKKADRVLRAAYNRAGRSRLCQDAKTQRMAYWPRGLTLSTGEDLPEGESLVSRVICLAWPMGAIDFDILTDLQKDRASGLHVGLMAAFIEWQARNREWILTARRQAQTQACRKLREAKHNNRTAEIAADLWSAWPILKNFAVEKELLPAMELEQLESRLWLAIIESTGSQATILKEADPVERFKNALAACLASGKAHLTHGDIGKMPIELVARCGWHTEEPKSPRLGYIAPSRNEVWLIPDAAYQEAARMTHLGVSEYMLWKKMAESSQLIVERGTRYRARRRDANLPPVPRGVDARDSFIVMPIDKLWPSEKDDQEPDEMKEPDQGQMEDIGTVQNNLSHSETPASAVSGSDGTSGTAQNPSYNHALASMDWKDEWGAELPFG